MRELPVLLLLFDVGPLKFCWVITGGGFVEAGVCQMKYRAMARASMMPMARMRVNLLLSGLVGSSTAAAGSEVSLRAGSGAIC